MNGWSNELPFTFYFFKYSYFVGVGNRSIFRKRAIVVAYPGVIAMNAKKVITALPMTDYGISSFSALKPYCHLSFDCSLPK